MEIPFDPMASEDRDPPVSLRLPPALLERLEKIVPRLARLPEFRLRAPSRNAAMKLALLKGLDALEAECPPADAAPSKERKPRRRR